MGNQSYYISQKKDSVGKICTAVIFIECTEIIWNKIYINGLCVSIFIKDMGWYLGVIGNLLNYECLIYIFTGEVLNDTPNILTN